MNRWNSGRTRSTPAVTSPAAGEPRLSFTNGGFGIATPAGGTYTYSLSARSRLIRAWWAYTFCPDLASV
ncbi:hypothetical protein [Kribbella sp. NPDC000426]|uniref:hypothetical protein n=1 Tax=Kribbella sp. NPDC000426 TaxID=3154255 RepID=UPI00331E6475